MFANLILSPRKYSIKHDTSTIWEYPPSAPFIAALTSHHPTNGLKLSYALGGSTPFPMKIGAHKNKQFTKIQQSLD